jgi:hypothetical protein
VSRIFHQHPTRPHLDELELSRMLKLAAAALGDEDELIMQSPRGSRVIPNRQRLAVGACGTPIDKKLSMPRSRWW